MEKKNAKLIFMALLAFAAIAWLGTIKNQTESAATYEVALEKADSFEKKGIYIDALNNYKTALEINSDNYDIAIKVADMYYKLNDIQGFITACDAAISLEPENPIAYERKVKHYISKFQYTEAITVLNTATKRIENNETLNKLKVELSTKCIEKYVSFNAVNDWHIQEDINYVAVENNGKWGMTLKDGSREINFEYDYVGAYDQETGVIPCCKDGLYYYIDAQGYKKYISDIEYQFLGSFGSELAPAQREGKYGYIDTEFNEQKFEFEFAGSFANNIAAVKKGGKWALINEKLEPITKYEYDEILMDTNGFCSNFNVIIAKKGDKYLFLNHEGKQIGKETFDMVSLPASNETFIAVKVGEKWGFADSKGKITIEPQYQNAKSFSMGIAPVEIEDRWGYINTKGEIVIETKYLDAGVFSLDGSAPVKNGTVWNFIVLCEYDK